MLKTIAINSADALANGDLTYRWLGSFWTSLFKDDVLLKRYSASQGILSAQLYLDFLETLNVVDRRTAPVFHRERWHMLTIKETERGTGNAAAVKLNADYPARIGPQLDIPYRVGEVLKIGGYAQLAGVTTYPLSQVTDSVGQYDMPEIATAIVDDVVHPTRILLKGVDYRIEDSTLIFMNNNDPFLLGFPVRSVATTSGTYREASLWAVDAMIDKDNVFNFVGSVLGINEASSEFYARYVNALWDLYNQGVSLSLFQSGLAAMLDEPCIIDATETVTQIISSQLTLQIITDTHVYFVNTGATLCSAVVVGAVLPRGTLLTTTVRVYDTLDPMRLAAGGISGNEFKLDVPALFLPTGFFRAGLLWGIGLAWPHVPIVFNGLDANGNPKLSFTLYGDADDISTFWSDFWTYCEVNQIDGQTCFTDDLRGTLPRVEGAVWGSVSPMEYFLSNYLKANLLVVSVDAAKLSTTGLTALRYLAELKNVLPAHVCLFVVEKVTVPTETYDCGATIGDVAVPMYSKMCYDVGGLAASPMYGLTYRDARPVAQLVPKCRGA